MRRRQQGRGTTGSDYDLTLVSGDFARDLHYRTRNVAAYAEQRVRVTPRWSVIPGARVERGTTRMTGRLDGYDPKDAAARCPAAYRTTPACSRCDTTTASAR